MAALYELEKQIAEFDLVTDDETGEIINIDELDALVMERDAKVENIAMWIKNLKAEEEAIKAETKRLQDRARVAGNKAERLKDYLATVLDGKKFSTPRVAISYRKSTAVVTGDPIDLPPEYIRTKLEADKTALKKDLEKGVDIPGAYLEERTSTIIK